MMRGLKLVGALVASTAAIGAIAPSAIASGSYTVYSCKAPSGADAPAADAQFGWQGSGSPISMPAGSISATAVSRRIGSGQAIAR